MVSHCSGSLRLKGCNSNVYFIADLGADAAGISDFIIMTVADKVYVFKIIRITVQYQKYVI